MREESELVTHSAIRGMWLSPTLKNERRDAEASRIYDNSHGWEHIRIPIRDINISTGHLPPLHS